MDAAKQAEGQDLLSPLVARQLDFRDVLNEPEWADLLTPADRRGLTPLFWSHVHPYGEVTLDMAARLNLTAVTVPSPRTAGDEEPAEEGADA